VENVARGSDFVALHKKRGKRLNSDLWQCCFSPLSCGKQKNIALRHIVGEKGKSGR
jgi:hypothetical protein